MQLYITHKYKKETMSHKSPKDLWYTKVGTLKMRLLESAKHYTDFMNPIPVKCYDITLCKIINKLQTRHILTVEICCESRKLLKAA